MKHTKNKENFHYQQAPFPALQANYREGKLLALNWRKKPSKQTNQATGALSKQCTQELKKYFSGTKIDFKWPLEWNQGTEFQRRVWKALCTIPYGETRSYAWLAKEVGSPRAVRAVGTANGANPFSLIVPCHRVIKSDGTLGGYTGGLHIKKRLLELEGHIIDGNKVTTAT